VCLPGGTYNHRYFDLQVPDRDGYSFARYLAQRGTPVAAFDVLGTGDSTQPDRELELVDQGTAADAATRHLVEELGHRGPVIGVGHSLGGYVLMEQQAAHRTFDAVAILGTTNQSVAQLELPADLVARCATAEGRAAQLAEFRSGFAVRYVEGGREPMHSWFHLADVPAEVIAADDATTLTVAVRGPATAGMTPGIGRDASARIDVPVFLAYGELDISPAPHLEPSFFPASLDVSLYVLRGSAHCHNMATTRHELWDRLAGWAKLVTASAG
jgi:pimeloyl-ACP methyl ester carboxylesterase